MHKITKKNLSLSIVAPAHNEIGNLKLFCQKSITSLKKITSKFEIIIIDDGSTDGSFKLLKKLKKQFAKLKAIRLRRCSGQTAALMAGFKKAKGNVIITIDADLQQDPKDIKKLVSKIISGADVVSGKRPKQKRAAIYILISMVEKLLIRLLLSANLPDTNVSPNAYRKETLNDINLVGEMHRYLVPILFWQGYKVESVNVSFHKRHSGQSNYKPTKAIKGFLDLFIVKFWQDYSARPIHFFGSIGLSLSFLGTLIGIITTIRKFAFHLTRFNVELLLLSVFLIIIGIQFFIFGILADIMTRIYFKNKSDYQIESVL